LNFYDIEIAASDLSDYLIGFGSFEVSVVGGLKGTSNSRERISSREGIMYHFATALIAGIIAAVLSGIAFVPTPAEAAKLSAAERVALEKATVATKRANACGSRRYALRQAVSFLREAASTAL
jgi:hypothetical protein